MRTIKLIPKDDYADDIENLVVVDEIIRGMVFGKLFLITRDGRLISLFSAIEQFKFPSPLPDGSRGATLTWALKGMALSDMPVVEFYEEPEHYIDPLI